MDAPHLLPTPASLVLHDGSWKLPAVLTVAGDPDLVMRELGRPARFADDGALALVHDPALAAEAYRLDIGNAGCRLAAAGRAGWRHGVRTLRQLIDHDRAPACMIADAPAFPVRGFMLDISRDRVPTFAELCALVATMAAWKLNHLQLYVEHTIAYAGHERVWREASPLTLDELRALDAYAADRGVELAANQNCLGHLERWLRHQPYTALAEIAPGASWSFPNFATMTGPFSLCPADPGAAALIDDLLGQLMPAVASPIVNIGCDEAYDLGQGRSCEAVASRGRAAVYLDWVAGVAQRVRAAGKRPAFWADIALEHPEHLHALPDDAIALCWGYEPDADFATWVEQVRSVGRSAWVCPGTSCWNSFTGRTQERRGNLERAARDGVAAGATGFLATAWGDYGHRQGWAVTLRGLADAAHHAWAGALPADPVAAGIHAFGHRDAAIWLDRLGDADLELRRTLGDGGKPLKNASAIFRDSRKGLDETWNGDADAWRTVFDILGGLGPPPASGDVRLAGECTLAWGQARWACERAWRRRAGLDASARRSLAAGLRGIIHEQRRQWLLRSRPGGLADALGHWERLLVELG